MQASLVKGNSSTLTGLYRGIYEDEKWRVELVRTGQRLPMRNDLRNHSPSGPSWGYSGSGPAQLALALLADYLKDDELALALYQDFKRSVVARWAQHQSWLLTREQLEAALIPLKEHHMKPYFVYVEDGGFVTADTVEPPAEKILWTGSAAGYEHALALAAKATKRFDPRTGLLKGGAIDV